MENLLVKKWWWENAAELIKSPQNIVKDFSLWTKQIIVVSALRSAVFNTTDMLKNIWKELVEERINREKIIELIDNIRYFHLSIIQEKLGWENLELIKKVNDFFDKFKNDILYYIENIKIIPSSGNDYIINTRSWKNISLIWFWEDLSAQIQSIVINALNIEWLSSEVADLSWVLDSINQDQKESDIFRELSQKVSMIVSRILDSWKVPIIWWFIPWFIRWIENTIWRWYTDAVAAMVSVWFAGDYDVILEIQKAVSGIMSADPRLLDKWNEARLIEALDYITAREITWVRWAQAKLLHSQVLREELQKAWIKVRLFNPFEEWKWTIISSWKLCKSRWVEYVWWRENIIYISVSSTKMMPKWVLFSIFWVVKDYASVDIVSTSETEVSFTIDGWISIEELNEMRKRIAESLEIDIDDVTYFKNKALVYCIWQNLFNNIWSSWKLTTALSKWWVNIEMSSQWVQERAMIVWIDWSDFRKAINLLHREFIK